MSAVMSISKGRIFGWLLKRELWEHRGIYLAPAILAGLMIVGALWGLLVAGGEFSIDGIRFGSDQTKEEVPHAVRFMVFAFFSLPFALVTFVVTAYYTLDALFADRRDRSALFWKSMPISDLETVLSKLGTAMGVIPLISILVSTITLLVLMVVASIALTIHGQSATVIWANLPLPQNLLMLVYLTIALSLSYAPIWAWCLLASAWARRAAFLWATLPLAGLLVLEKQALGTNHFALLLRDRFSGAVPLATGFEISGANGDGNAINSELQVDIDHVNAALNADSVTALMDPLNYLTSLHLWGGLAVAAVFIAAAVWMRRYRDVE